MREVVIVWRALFVRNMITLKRYLFNTLSGLITMYIVFLLLMTGARVVGGTTFMDGEAPLQGLVISYCVWVFAMQAYQELAWGITNEAQMGTLEKLYLAPIGFLWVQALYQLSVLSFQIGVVAVLLGIIVLTTGVTLQMDLVSVIPILIITIFAASGLGFLMGGLGLIYKRVQAAFQILQFALIGFLALPTDWGRFAPLNLGNRMLSSVMVEGTRIWQFSSWDLLTLVAVNLGYMSLGLLSFRILERKARERGLLGHY